MWKLTVKGLFSLTSHFTRGNFTHPQLLSPGNTQGDWSCQDCWEEAGRQEGKEAPGSLTTGTLLTCEA